jgi:hypothetical protein
VQEATCRSAAAAPDAQELKVAAETLKTSAASLLLRRQTKATSSPWFFF